MQIKNVTIVGGGSSGWISAAILSNQFKNLKITVVESPNIPIIGVGESTTLNFMAFLRDTFGYNLNQPCKHFMKFLVDIDAALKYGVYYENWAEQSFLHEFCNMSASVMNQIDNRANLKIMLFGKFNQIWQTGHRPIIFHDFANHRCGVTPRERR